MLVRRFRDGDEAALFTVFFSAIHHVASRDYSHEQINAWAPTDFIPEVWAERVRGIKPFVVEIDGLPIAYADLQGDGYIDHFFVSGNYTGHGAGRLLMETIHKQAADNKIVTLSADVSLTAKPFFEHFGFVAVEARTPVVRGVAIPNVFMRKTLMPLPSNKNALA